MSATLGFMHVFANVVSYGLALGAAACLSVALTKLAVRAARSRTKRG